MATDLDFAIFFSGRAGVKIKKMRTRAERSTKLDRTVVTAADIEINEDFIRMVRRHDRTASVMGEERSHIVKGARRVWVIDPIDGTGEYINDSIHDADRTTCIGIALLDNGVLVLSVVYNPFRNELFVAELGATATRLNDQIVSCSPLELEYGSSYDYCQWDDADYDLRGFEQIFGRRQGSYSAIYQACNVAAGRSLFAAFPGNTLHDIAPSVLLVTQAGGVVTDLFGRPLDWRNLNRGALYATANVHQQALRCIRRML